jgi:hypothetical protein
MESYFRAVPRTLPSMEELIERLSTFQSQLLLSIHGIPESELNRPEGADRWSILNVVAHLVDDELVMALRLRRVLVEEEPMFEPFPQELWVDRLHHGATLDLLIEQFGELRHQNIVLIRSLGESALARTGTHPLVGVLSVRDLVERLIVHQDKHLGQIERIKSTLGLTTSSGIDVSRVEAVLASTVPHRSPGPGIRVRDLWQRGVKRALQVEIDPGAAWPSIDYHVPGPEELYVVSGEFEDGVNRWSAGTFIHHPAGSSHIGQSRTGCVLFVYYPEG